MVKLKSQIMPLWNINEKIVELRKTKGGIFKKLTSEHSPLATDNKELKNGW